VLYRGGEDNLFRTLHHHLIDWQDLIHNMHQSVEGWLNRVTPLDGNLAMQDFLKHFGVRHQSSTIQYDFLEQVLGVCFVAVRRAYKIHRNVRIDQNHG
jgi:hypothetical protein